MAEPTTPMRVTAMRWEAAGVISLELSPIDGAPVAPVAPGAHIDLVLPTGLTRSYSLINAPGEMRHYAIAIALDPASRGGSRYIHEQLRLGQQVQVGGPRNHFALVDDERAVVLIAGGIGITPLLCMMRTLAAAGRRYTAYYAARHVSRAAFLNEIKGLGETLVTHFDAEHDGRTLDIADVIRRHPGAHFYCCGPAPMLAAFEAATDGLAPDTVHLEYFAARPVDAPGTESVFNVVLHRSGRTLEVTAQQTVLQALNAAGVAVTSACESGICGSCETRVLAGQIDHRDSVLTKSERAAGDTMMVCVSRCRSAALVLDL